MKKKERRKERMVLRRGPCTRAVWVLMTAFGLALLVPPGRTQPAQECHVYHLQNKQHKSQTITFSHQLVVSLWPVDQEPSSLVFQIQLESNVTVYVNEAGEAVVRVKDVQQGGPLPLRPALRSTWLTLVLTLAHPYLLLHRIGQQQETLMTRVGLQGEVQAFVSTTSDLFLAFNCAAGCLVYNGMASPFLELEATVGDLAIYLRLGDEPDEPSFTLHPPVSLHLSDLDREQWYTLVQKDDGDDNSVVIEDAHRLSVLTKNMNYSVTNASNVFWSVYCCPDEANCSQETNGLTITPQQKKGRQEEEKEEEKGAGVGQVLAWVLAALALFFVLVLALALCNKSRQSETTDFLPSVGVLSREDDSADYETPEREPEEASEPGSPTVTLPPFRHHDRSEKHSTKVL